MFITSGSTALLSIENVRGGFFLIFNCTLGMVINKIYCFKYPRQFLANP